VVHNNEEMFTRHNADYSSKSSPDITISHENNSNNISNWHTIAELSSDHLPILFSIKTATATNVNTKVRMTWNWKAANWANYTKSLEDSTEQMNNNDNNSTAFELERNVRKDILRAAYRHVGLKKVGNKPKQYLPDHILQAIRNRNTLREHNNPEHMAASLRIKEDIAQ